MSDRVSWYIDGKPVVLSGWSADMVSAGGFRNFQGTAKGNARGAEQGAPVEGFRRDGSPFWYGEMTLDPEVTEGGMNVQADGLYKSDFATTAGRRFFINRDESSWKPMESPPYGYPVVGDAMEYTINAGLHEYGITVGEGIATGDSRGAALWADGEPLTNLAFDIDIQKNNVNFGVRILSANGPDGTLSQEGADIQQGVANSGFYTYPLTATGGDLVVIRWRRNAGAGVVANKLKGFITNIEVRGLATTSVFTLDQVLNIVMNIDGRAPNLQASGVDVMPLDWSGTDYDLVSYVTRLADWWFMILEKDDSGTHSAAGPWEDVIHVARRRNARTSLTPLRRYNAVRVPWQNTTGDEQFSIANAQPDPFPGREVLYNAETLLDKFETGSTVPQSIADILVKRFSAIRRTGTLVVSEARREGKRLSPYEIRPAVLVDIEDHDPAIPPQRVVAVSWSSSGTASLSIEAESGAVTAIRNTSDGYTPGQVAPPDPGGRRQNR